MHQREKYAVICGIPTDELKNTIIQVRLEGWEISEQNYSGNDLWELVLVK